MSEHMTKNIFKINDYEAEFVRFHLTTQEVIYFFMELCRTNHVLQIGLIIRPNEILVDKNYIPEFDEWCKDLDIHFVNDNGKFPADREEWLKNVQDDVFSLKLKKSLTPTPKPV